MSAPRALYIHIPFCDSICGYCDFCKLIYNEHFAHSYLEHLFAELDSFHIESVDTIYIGGGTPTSLSDPLFEKLLKKVSDYLAPEGEFTVEGNPENISKNKILMMARFGVNRVSIGMESSSPRLLDLMGRKHSFEKVRTAVETCRKNGILNINLDLMYALPDETNDELDADLETILSLDPSHISTYSLILEDNSLFKKRGIKEASDDIQADQYERILSKLRDAGYERYEVSNFAKDGFRSRHNLVYWHDEEYFGAGLGAAGYIDGIRYTNTRSFSQYIKNQDKRLASERVEGEDAIRYFLLTNLRLAEGFEISRFDRLFQINFAERYENVLPRLTKEGLIRIEGGRVKPTDKGILLLDRVLLDLY